MSHSRVLRRKESGGSATNGFAISSVAFVRRSHWQVGRGRLSLAADSCPENRRSNGEQSCHGEIHDPSGRHATESGSYELPTLLHMIAGCWSFPHELRGLGVP